MRAERLTGQSVPTVHEQKTRCDKAAPCGTCVKRGKAHLCQVATHVRPKDYGSLRGPPSQTPTVDPDPALPTPPPCPPAAFSLGPAPLPRSPPDSTLVKTLQQEVCRLHRRVEHLESRLNGLEGMLGSVFDLAGVGAPWAGETSERHEESLRHYTESARLESAGFSAEPGFVHPLLTPVASPPDRYDARPGNPPTHARHPPREPIDPHLARQVEPDRIALPAPPDQAAKLASTERAPSYPAPDARSSFTLPPLTSTRYSGSDLAYPPPFGLPYPTTFGRSTGPDVPFPLPRRFSLPDRDGESSQASRDDVQSDPVFKRRRTEFWPAPVVEGDQQDSTASGSRLDASDLDRRHRAVERGERSGLTENALGLGLSSSA
ncbi:hypothetical protein JCM10212_007004 [Sporobolomyces blumeae]